MMGRCTAWAAGMVLVASSLAAAAALGVGAGGTVGVGSRYAVERSVAAAPLGDRWDRRFDDRIATQDGVIGGPAIPLPAVVAAPTGHQGRTDRGRRGRGRSVLAGVVHGTPGLKAGTGLGAQMIARGTVARSAPAASADTHRLRRLLAQAVVQVDPRARRFSLLIRTDRRRSGVEPDRRLLASAALAARVTPAKQDGKPVVALLIGDWGSAGEARAFQGRQLARFTPRAGGLPVL